MGRRHDRRMADAAILDTATPRGESRWRVLWRNAFPFLVVAAIWEIVARAGVFPVRLFPPLEVIAAATDLQIEQVQEVQKLRVACGSPSPETRR